LTIFARELAPTTLIRSVAQHLKTRENVIRFSAAFITTAGSLRDPVPHRGSHRRICQSATTGQKPWHRVPRRMGIGRDEALWGGMMRDESAGYECR
jgi:hypothetical protein